MSLEPLLTAYAADLAQRGSSAAYAAKQTATVRRAGSDPAAFLSARSASWTAATLTDHRTRLACFGNWLKSASPDSPNPWLSLPRGIKAGKVARGRASFTAEEVGRLLGTEGIPAHRKAFYRCVATLGLRPVEASRIEAQHVVREGAGFVLRLPGASQKSGRADVVYLEAWQAREILENLPLVRRSLGHFEEVFQRDLLRARVQLKQGDAMRRLYDLRSWMISHLMREGVDPVTVQKLVRHKRIETTMRFYVRHSESRAGEVRAEVFKGLKPKGGNKKSCVSA